jgi:hypothetical protein
MRRRGCRGHTLVELLVAMVVSDLFVDGDGDGLREWRTVLVGTATAQRLNQGVVFALDVTEPLAPPAALGKLPSGVRPGTVARGCARLVRGVDRCRNASIPDRRHG